MSHRAAAGGGLGRAGMAGGLPHWNAWAGALIVLGFLGLLGCFHLIYLDFYLTPRQEFGTDYSFNLPALLDIFFGYSTNGGLDPPSFTPPFCGGQPNLASPLGLYYSLPAFLTRSFDPLTSICLSIDLFAGLGYWGMCGLLVRVFETPRSATFVGGALFLFNDFYIHRMLAGHLNFQAFILIPLIVALLLPGRRAENQDSLAAETLVTVSAGWLLAYFYFSGFAVLVVPAASSILALARIQPPAFRYAVTAASGLPGPAGAIVAIRFQRPLDRP